MTTIIDWPAALKKHGQVMPWLEKNVASSGASLSGIERVVVTDAGRWRYGFSTMIWNKRGAADTSRILAWRALITKAEGRGHIIRVPINDIGVTADITPGTGTATVADDPSVPHSDDMPHDDDMGYDQPSFPPVSGGQGSTTMKITCSGGFVPQPGQFFSLYDRLYAIKTATLVTGTDYQLTFVPRLRSSASLGDSVLFETLTCLMRLTEETMARVEQPVDLISHIDLEFVEAAYEIA